MLNTLQLKLSAFKAVQSTATRVTVKVSGTMSVITYPVHVHFALRYIICREERR